MFTSISKGVNQLHRVALNQAMHKQNAKWSSIKSLQQVIILVGTKNIIPNLFMAIFSTNTIMLYFTGFGRIYTDFGIIGRLAFILIVWLTSLRHNRHFIVENGHDRRVIAGITRRPVTQINGSGFNKSLYGTPTRTPPQSPGKVIGHMSRFGTSKCTDEILKLIETLPPDYRIIIAGKDISGSFYSHQFYQMAETNPQVEMIGFLETPKEVSSFFNRIDVFLYPSIREGLPITLLESIYHKVPFLTTNVAGCIDISNSFGFPACAPEDFGTQDKHLHIDTWGAYTPRWNEILEDYTTAHVQKQFEAIFAQVATTHHPQSPST